METRLRLDCSRGNTIPPDFVETDINQAGELSNGADLHALVERIENNEGRPS